MTVSRTNSSTRAVANGTATTFNYSFVLYSAGDMQVLDGADIVNPSLYTVNIAGDYLGGSVEFDTAPAANSIITMQRSMTLDQQTSYPVAGAFQPQTHERALDKLTLLLQQVADSIEGARIATNWLGQWTTATAYSAKDLIYAPTYVTAGLYYCLESHTSGDLAADLAAGRWTRILDLTTIVAGEPSLGLPVADGDALTSAADGTRAWVAKENALGDPASDGLALVSTTAGVRSWSALNLYREHVVGTPYAELAHLNIADSSNTLDSEGYIYFSGSNITVSTDVYARDFEKGVDLLLTDDVAYSIPTTANTLLHHFVVKLVSTGVITCKSYTSFHAAFTDNLISARVYLGSSRNAASGGAMSSMLKRGVFEYNDPATMPVVAASLTTSMASYNLSDLCPTMIAKTIQLLITGTAAGVIDIAKGGSSEPVTRKQNYATGEMLVISMQPSSVIGMKYTTGNCSVKILGYTI